MNFCQQEKHFFTYQVKGSSYMIGTVNTILPSQSNNSGIFIIYFTTCLFLFSKKQYLYSRKHSRINTYNFSVNMKQMIPLYMYVCNIDNYNNVFNVDITIVIISMDCNMVVTFENCFCEIMKFENMKIKVLIHDYERKFSCNGYEYQIKLKILLK